MAGALLQRRSRRPSIGVGWVLCHVRPSRQIRCLSEAIDSPIPLSKAHRKTEPPQSDFFRFALTGALRLEHAEDSGSNTERLFRNSFIEQWRTRTTPLPLWDSESKTSPEDFASRLKDVHNIRELQRIVEHEVDSANGRFLMTEGFDEFRRILEEVRQLSPLGDILTLINLLGMRLKGLKITQRSRLHALAMQYAALGFCDMALRRNLDGYLSTTKEKLSMAESLKLVKTLRSSLKAISLQHPGYDTKRMRNIVSGDYKTAGLYSILRWRENINIPNQIGAYLALLVQIQDDTMHLELWRRQLNKKTWDSGGWDVTSAYEYALALAEVGDLPAALTVLTKVSQRLGNTLPHLAEFHGLADILQHDILRNELNSLVKGPELQAILDCELKRIENRLGIEWQPTGECHVGASGPPWQIASDQPIFTMDGESAGYGSNGRLVAEIEALGCSRSRGGLESIAKLLGEYEGDLIRVCIPPWDSSDSEFYWAPECSAHDFSETHPSVNTGGDSIELAHELGLIRVCAERNHFFARYSLHLMQLGYLYKKQKSRANDGLDVPPELEKTGHLVAWDRIHGCFMAVFAGNGFGSTATISEFQESVTCAGADSIAQIYPLAEEGPDEDDRYLYFSRYRFEVDSISNPGDDISPDP
ncbi:hypothetical protein BJX64DRAFT_253577 [Aspergillus heterothallicus]